MLAFFKVLNANALSIHYNQSLFILQSIPLDQERHNSQAFTIGQNYKTKVLSISPKKKQHGQKVPS
jgi:hypothetical protein